jgi:hypothetical protein
LPLEHSLDGSAEQNPSPTPADAPATEATNRNLNA